MKYKRASIPYPVQFCRILLQRVPRVLEPRPLFDRWGLRALHCRPTNRINCVLFVTIATLPLR